MFGQGIVVRYGNFPEGRLIPGKIFRERTQQELCTERTHDDARLDSSGVLAWQQVCKVDDKVRRGVRNARQIGVNRLCSHRTCELRSAWLCRCRHKRLSLVHAMNPSNRVRWTVKKTGRLERDIVLGGDLGAFHAAHHRGFASFAARRQETNRTGCHFKGGAC